ncbi:hypothetical protein CsSME_00047326 [Camellia sinensis var. sinensis]
MAGDTKTFRERVPTAKTFMFNSIPKKATKTRTRFKLGVFMRLKENKAGRAKNPKISIGRGSAMQTFKGSLIMDDRGRSTIDSVDSSEDSFPPKAFRAGRREKESASSVKNMPMFPFSTAILLGRASIGTMRQCTMTLKKRKKIGIPILHSIVRAKKFDGFGKLGVDHLGKSIIKGFKFRPSFHEKNPSKP